MNLRTIIFFGRSGSGKGTQAKLISEYLKEGGRKTLSIGTGNNLRKLSEKDNHTGKLVSEVIENGDLIATFIPIWSWTDVLVNEFSGEENLIFDGLARRPIEAPVLHHALKFYNRAKGADVVYIDVSEKWAIERLKGRGRNDDNDKDITKRLEWFNSEVKQSIDFFRKKPHYYNFHEINGEQTIEEVHQEIVKKLFS